MGASTFQTGQTGQYTIASGPSSTDVTNCDEVWLSRNVQTDQQIQSTDCSVGDSLFSDVYLLSLRAGQQVTITQSSTAVNEFLFAVYINVNGSFVVVGSDVGGPAATAQFTFTAPVTSFTASSNFAPYFLFAATDSTFETGAYSLTVVTTGLGVGPVTRQLPPGALRNSRMTTRARLEELLHAWAAAAAASRTRPGKTRP
jgi:hypothetical protein